MIKRLCVLVAVMLFTTVVSAQNNYSRQLKNFRSTYISHHEVVKGKEKNLFRFFPVDSSYVVTATFQKIDDTTGFSMKTSAGTDQAYFKYGKISFRIKDTTLQLYIYQSKQLRYTSYRDYLFIPFTDLTTGEVSYPGGRYLDLLKTEIKDNQLIIDFNKAYNPYCAYATGYHCPLPPRENFVAFAIKAGEKAFAKKLH
jgi:uncharacterized protein (DUF1684 family)